MSGRQPPAGPTWRAPQPRLGLELEQVFVVCRCGADMLFRWPGQRADVRCFACGARFERPGHLPAAAPPPAWRPTVPARGLTLTRPLLGLLLLVALAAGLLGAALTLAIGR